MPKILKGFRDYLPEKMIQRERIIDIVKNIYKRFGYEPLETPALEYAQTLLGKYGDEGEKLVYRFKDYGNREVALRYDLTVPLARVISMYPNLPFPFKVYQVSPVWRAEKPQKGRFREFIQCDLDIIGSSSMIADAEIIQIIYKVMNALNLDQFVIQINNRKILDGLISYLKIKQEKSLSIFRTLDKLEKIGIQRVKEELSKQKIEKKKVEKILEFIKIQGKNQQILNKAKKLLQKSLKSQEGIKELESILNYARVLEIPEKNLKINFSIVRGLDYYTGSVFETTLLDCSDVGSVFSGGRYDNLIGMFLEKNIPAVGGSLGIDRILSAMETLKMLPEKKSTTKVLVTIFDKSTEVFSLKLAQQLRDLKINTEIYLGKGNLSKQFKYADKKKIPFVVIIGPKEIERKEITIKELKSGKEKKIKIEKLREILKLIRA